MSVEMVLEQVSDWPKKEKRRLFFQLAELIGENEFPVENVEKQEDTNSITLAELRQAFAGHEYQAGRKYRAEDVAGIIKLKQELKVEDEQALLEEALIEKYG